MSRLVADEILAAFTIRQEAGGEPPEGRLAVAEVIRNRMRARYESDGTVAGTVLAPFQFSSWNTTDRRRSACFNLDDTDPVYQQCLTAWLTAMNGSQSVKGALLYFNPHVVMAPGWVRSCVLVATVGQHEFYRPK